ncbi:MAG TPA: DUF6415 family natural product biosynthesis protein [Candidatus Eisenbacteria bacterium]|nr:DUF6415 family natural product biosynthesis protein [Candidatus Eisenbacteria bacterium]
MNAAVDNASTTAPVDLATMRESVDVLLDPEGAPAIKPPSGADLDTLTEVLRGHLRLLIPELEAAARKLGRDSIRRYCVLGCLGEARIRLRAEPSPRYNGPIGHARRLARALNALCDHYEQLTAPTP